MDIKYFTQSKPNGEIVSIVETTRPFEGSSLLEIVEITDHPKLNDILNKQAYFEYKNGSVVEKNALKKKEVDDKEKEILSPKVQIDKVAELEGRIKKLEESLKIK